jgi:hypothetical protein
MCWRKLSCLLEVVAQKVLPVVDEILLLLLALLVGEGHRALFAEGRIRENVVHGLRRLGDEGIG